MDLLLLLVAPRTAWVRRAAGFLMDEAAPDPLDLARLVTPSQRRLRILRPSPRRQGDALFDLPTWHRLQAQGRLYGAVMDAFWMHVATGRPRRGGSEIGVQRLRRGGPRW